MSRTMPARTTGRSVALAVGAALMAIGLAAWVYELRHGLVVTGMRHVISWGLYIVTFAFFVKLSAGGLIVASAAEVFGIVALKPLARLGALTAAICVAVAAAAIVPDLGRPDRMVNLVLHPNWRSPMVWDVAIVAAYFLLAVFELHAMGAPLTSPRRRRLRWLALLGLPAAVTLHSVTAWIFGLQVARPFWNSALMAPLFVISAIVSGTALLVLIVAALRRWAGVEYPALTWRALRLILVVGLAIDLFFLVSEYVTVLWARVPHEMVTLRMILPGGEFQALFYLEWLLGGAVPLLLLSVPATRERVGATVTSAALILVGIFTYQFELTTVGLTNPLVQLAPGVSSGAYTAGQAVFEATGHYAPTWVEYAIVAGLVGGAGVLVILGYRALGLSDKAERAVPA